MRRLLSLMTLFALRAAAADFHVPADYATIGAALAAAAPGDRVLVAAGDYSPSTNGESFPLFITTPGVSLVGAGAGGTVLDAEGSATVIELNGGARLAHCTITGGNGDWGGGIDVSAGNPEIDHLWVIANAALRRGSGINVQGDAAPWIHHNVVYANFDSNLAHSGDPHGIQLGGTSQALVEHNLVAGGDSNGLITQELADSIVRNNIFFDNGIDGERGRGICALSNANTVVAYNLFHANSIAAMVVPGPFNLSASEANDFDAMDDIYGNLDGDPLLGNLVAFDFLLASSSSPAIDAGDPASALDPDGTRADIGPYYYGYSSTGTSTGLQSLVLLRYGPNPTQGAVQMSLRSARAGWGELLVVDPRGRQLSRERRWIEAGSSQLRWDGSRLAQGLYFVRIRLDGATIQTPLLIVK